MTGWGSINPAGDVWGPVLKQDYAELWTNQVSHVVTRNKFVTILLQCHDTQACEEAYGEPGWITEQMLCAGYHVTGGEDEERCMTTGMMCDMSRVTIMYRDRVW